MVTQSVRAGLAAFLTVVAVPLAAQQPAQQSDTVTVTGIVVDGLTGRPLPGVLVSVDAFDWGVMTEQDGTFVLPRVPVGRTALAFNQLGYADLVVTRAIEAGMTSLRIELQPQPIVLEGIKVMADRFKRRRMATPMTVQAYGSRELRAAPYDVLDFLRYRTFVHVSSCGTGSIFFNCVWSRGRIVHPRVVVDEFPRIAGLDVLVGMPSSMVYLVEVYGYGRQIRVYTNDFMRNVARHPLAPIPLWW